MISPIASAFTFMVIHPHAPANCIAPKVIWSSVYVDTVCQAVAKPEDRAVSCYDRHRRLIILKDGWRAFNRDDEALLYHEMYRHVWQACLKRSFTATEPEAVVEAEELAP